jgi:serine/threonine-protein kinase
MGAGLPEDGERFGGYRLIDQLGRGGMGVVYRAEHVHLGRIVALKVLAPDLSTNQAFRDRFLRESRLAAGLDHPSVVPVYDAGDVDGTLYLAMRLVKGEDLSSVLERRGPLDPDEAVSIFGHVGSALDAAHAAGLVHRDVKPGNVLVADGQAYLTDFGLTKPTTKGDSATALTATGVFLGTPDYAAPEQIAGEEVDARTDVYAFTAMLHECLTGSRPFARDSQVAVLYAHLHDPPPQPSQVRPGLPPALDAVVAAGMAKAPGHRYDSCGALMAAARDALATSTQSAPRGTAVATPAATTAGAAPPPATAGAAQPATTAGASAPAAPDAAPRRFTAAPPPLPTTGSPAPPPERRRLPIVLGLLAAVVIAGVVLALVLGGGDEGGEGNAGGGAGTPRVVGSPLPVGQRPFGVEIGSGVIWVANNDDGTVTRVGTDGRARTDIRVGDRPFGMTQAGPAFWVANQGGDSVTRLDIATGRAGDPIPVGDSPFFLTADQSTVFVSNGGDGTVTAIDARTGRVVGDPIQVGGQLRGIASTGSAVWVADKQANTVKRIVNGRVVTTIPVGRNPVEVAFGNEALWVTNKDDGTVSRIDLRGEAGEAKTIRVGREPQGIAFGEGFAWVANGGSDNVMRLDPDSGEVVGDPIRVPGQPVGIAARNGEVWVTSNDAGTATRIAPR